MAPAFDTQLIRDIETLRPPLPPDRTVTFPCSVLMFLGPEEYLRKTIPPNIESAEEFIDNLGSISRTVLSSLLRSKNEDSCETVTFKRKESARSVRVDATDKMAEPDKGEKKSLDIKKLRYEVIKFGSSGFEGSKKEESRAALAVALGAVPRKRRRKNYVQILAEKKAEKEKRDKEFKPRIAKNRAKKGASKQKKTDGNKTKGLLNSYGRVKPNK